LVTTITLKIDESRLKNVIATEFARWYGNPLSLTPAQYYGTMERVHVYQNYLLSLDQGASGAFAQLLDQIQAYDKVLGLPRSKPSEKPADVKQTGFADTSAFSKDEQREYTRLLSTINAMEFQKHISQDDARKLRLLLPTGKPHLDKMLTKFEKK
jgi:hypothetical protein